MSLLGAINFVRSVIPNCSTLLHPLSKMTSKNVKFEWTAQHDDILEKIKQYICENTSIKHIDFNKEIDIYTDASDHGIGSVIMQNGKPVWFVSKKLSKAQQNYTVIEKETLAIIHTLTELRHILLGFKINLYTDHSNLTYLKDINSSRTQRWLLTLSEFNLNIVHLPGKNNTMADFLSRKDRKENLYQIEEYIEYPLNYEKIRKWQEELNFEKKDLKLKVLEGIKLWCLDDKVYIPKEYIFLVSSITLSSRISEII